MRGPVRAAPPVGHWAAIRDDDVRRLRVHFGTVEEGFGAVFPVNEFTFRRLYGLQRIINNALHHAAASRRVATTSSVP